jgi:hypothetical protein
LKWGTDLQSEHERYLTEKHVKRPVIVLNYPKEIKAFYMRVNDDAKAVAAMDVLAPDIGEIIGGSQRDAASTRSTTLRIQICVATARFHTPGLASVSSGPSPASLAFPTCVTPSHFREHREMRSAKTNPYRGWKL